MLLIVLYLLQNFLKYLFIPLRRITLFVKDENDNPTIGILLCTETDKVLAKYSVLNGSEQLFAAKYMAYMPTEEELSREIEQQKRFFLEQHGMEE